MLFKIVLSCYKKCFFYPKYFKKYQTYITIKSILQHDRCFWILLECDIKLVFQNLLTSEMINNYKPACCFLSCKPSPLQLSSLSGARHPSVWVLPEWWPCHELGSLLRQRAQPRQVISYKSCKCLCMRLSTFRLIKKYLV